MDLAVALIRTTLNTTSLVAPRLAGRAAFALFCRPLRRGRVRTIEREVHDRAVTEKLHVNGKSVTAYRWGSGERPVLLLHGWQSRTSRYAGFVPGLQALGLSPIGFDAPGHGDSAGQATTILEYRELIGQLQEKYGEFEAVIAHSFGVTCAFYALRDGIRAGRLVAIAGVAEFGYLLDEFCAQLGLRPRVKRELREHIERRLFPQVPDLWNRFDATRRPQEVELPLLLVHDEDDAMVALQQVHKLKAAYGEQAELLVTTGLGHRRILAEPTVVDNALGFLLDQPAEESRSCALLLTDPTEARTA